MQVSTFIEFGTGGCPELYWLLQDNWKDYCDRFLIFGGERLVEYTDTWFGIFVEPHPYNLQQTLKKLNEVDPSGKKYQLFSTLIMGSNKIAQFYPSSDFNQIDESASVFITERSISLHFPTMTLDQLVVISPYPVDLIRSDCEGAELEVFENFSFQPKPQHLIIETHGNVLGTAGKLHQFLLNKNYQVSEFHYESNNYLVAVL